MQESTSTATRRAQRLDVELRASEQRLVASSAREADLATQLKGAELRISEAGEEARLKAAAEQEQFMEMLQLVCDKLKPPALIKKRP